MAPEDLAAEYEKVKGYIVHRAERPTTASVAFVEDRLGVKLPESLVRFAKAAPSYGNWLASLGPDFDSPTHILNMNDVEAREEMPENFIVINVGYDEDYDCIDTETLDPSTGEYLITYWSPDAPLRESELFSDFVDYMRSRIYYWSGKRT